METDDIVKIVCQVLIIAILVFTVPIAPLVILLPLLLYCLGYSFGLSILVFVALALIVAIGTQLW